MAQDKEKEIIFEKLKNYCSCSFVYRNEVDKLTGGLLLPRTMTNRDSNGTGVKKRMLIGKRIAYDLDELIGWLKDNTKLINFEN